jgi:hypothetical protein
LNGYAFFYNRSDSSVADLRARIQKLVDIKKSEKRAPYARLIPRVDYQQDYPHPTNLGGLNSGALQLIATSL